MVASATSTIPPPKAKTSGGAMSTILEIILIAVLAAGAGGGIAMLNPPSAAPSPESKQAPTAANCGVSGVNLLDLPPVVTNIGSPTDTWVRMEASIIFDAKATQHPEIMAAEIATDELAYLRTIALTQLQGPIGLENIRQDLTDRAVVRSGGKVTELVLRTLVVQ